MHIDWLHRNNQRQCILFFSGWGMDPAPFRFLPAANHDLCLFSDYRQLQPVDLALFAGYEQLHLIGWSMGVWVAAHLLADQAAAFASATALGGTLTPIDQQRGLPPDSYADMLDHFSQEVLDTFYRNMFDDEEQLARFLATRPQRDLPGLRDEMAAFRDAFLCSGSGHDIYSHKIITSRDRIFPGRNQMRAWGKGCGAVHNWPHFPFFLLGDWRELLPS
jgi:biotin synthesis protein BioG